MLQQMISALRSKPLGQGMAQQAAEKLQTVPGYREYAIQAQSSGKAPVSIEEYMKGAR